MGQDKLPAILEEWIHEIILECPSCYADYKEGTYNKELRRPEWALVIPNWTPETITMECTLCQFSFTFSWEGFTKKFFEDLKSLERYVKKNNPEPEDKQTLLEMKQCAELLKEWPKKF